MSFTLESYHTFLSHDLIINTAKETGFMKRNKGVSPVDFLKSLLIPSLNVASDPLRKISLELSKSKIYVSRQSIFEKLNQSCVDFLELLLKSLVSKTQGNSKVFNLQGLTHNIPQVLIADSSTITLDPIHKEAFPGLSSKLKSMIKILLAIDPMTLSISSIELAEGKKSDQKLNEHLFNFKKDALILKDLGFSSVKDQEKIELHKGKYISRVKLDTHFYIPQTPRITKDGKIIKSSRFEKIDISKIYKDLKENEVVNTTYYFKNGDNFYSKRTIITKVPDHKLERRRKSAESKVRSSEHKISEKTEQMLPFNIYVTNLKEEEIPAENIHTIYARRWDIELIFKKLKSTYDLDKVKVKVRIERILIQIYSKLILFALECLYTQDIVKALPQVAVSPAKIGKFLKSYLEGVFKSGKKQKIPLNYLIIQLKKDIKKSRSNK